MDPATPKERAGQMVPHQGEPSQVFERFKVDMGVGTVSNQGNKIITQIT
ncbi:hypothetical protein ACI77F_26100 [Pseudomonas tritici]